MFKEGDHWRRNEPDNVKQYFHCKLKSLIEKRFGKKSCVSKLARLLGVSKQTIGDYINFVSMPPSDKQALIAVFLNCKSRADIWVFKKSMLPELRKIASMYEKIEVLEKQFKERKETFKKK